MTIGATNQYGYMNLALYRNYIYGSHRAATTAPVEPVAKAPAVVQGRTAQIYVSPVSTPETSPSAAAPLLPQMGPDFTEMAVRSRIQYLSPEETAKLGGKTGTDANSQALAVPGLEGTEGAKAPGEAMNEGECQTCSERKYQDGSNDLGVSFKTPTRLTPEEAAYAVRGHEQEHVVREQAKAEREDRKVVYQSVRLHTDICPECGKPYISGGLTTTVTAGESEPVQENPTTQAPAARFSAVA